MTEKHNFEQGQFVIWERNNSRSLTTVKKVWRNHVVEIDVESYQATFGPRRMIGTDGRLVAWGRGNTPGCIKALLDDETADDIRAEIEAENQAKIDKVNARAAEAERRVVETLEKYRAEIDKTQHFPGSSHDNLMTTIIGDWTLIFTVEQQNRYDFRLGREAETVTIDVRCYGIDGALERPRWSSFTVRERTIERALASAIVNHLS